MNNRKNVLLLWNRIGEYHVARVNAFRQLYQAGEVHSAELGVGDQLYQWEGIAQGNHHHVLSVHPVERPDLYRRIRAYIRLIRQLEISVVVQPGYAQPSYFFFLFINRLLRVQTIIFAESWYPGNDFKDLLKSVLLKWTVDGFFVSGQRANEFFGHRLRQSAARIAKGYSAIDNDHFQQTGGNRYLKEDYLLCVARYSEEKNLKRLIEGFRQSRAYGQWKLLLVGDGPQRDELSKLVKNDPCIDLTGWKKYTALPALYHHARGFILPSTFEPWGLVVNEAMAAGTVVAMASQCGCMPDLKVSDDLVFDAENTAAITEAIDALFLLSDEVRLTLIDQQSVKINTMDCPHWAVQLKSLVS